LTTEKGPILTGPDIPVVKDDPAELEPIQDATSQARPSRDVKMLSDVKLRVTVELGRAKLLVRNVLNMRKGAVIQLDKLAGETVDVFVNDVFLARGEIVVIADMLAVRLTTIAAEPGEEEQVQDTEGKGDGS